MMRWLFLLVPVAAVAPLVSSCSSHSDATATTYDSLDQMLDPQTCNQCHQTHYSDWSGSMHAYASDDPVFLAMNARAQRETNNAVGSFCVQCHAPMALMMKATTNGLNLASVPQKLKGVTCYFCHSVDAVNGSHNDPLHLATDLTMRGPFPLPGSTDQATPNSVHKSEYSQLHDRSKASSATLCGACHDITTNLGADAERTFAEWQASVFSTPAYGDTCGECHMAQSTNLEPVANYPGVAARELHAHNFPAVDQALTPGFPNAAAQQTAIQSFLDSTLQTAVCVESRGGQSSLRVIIDNVAAGHGFPSGAAQDRRFWVEIIASQAGNVLYQSGVVPVGSNPVVSPDPDAWLMRDCIFDQNGKPVSFLWQEASFDGNELPAQLTADMTDPRFYQSHVYWRFPLLTDSDMYFNGTPDTVTVRFRLQAIGSDVLQDLVSSGDLDPSVASAMTTLEVGSNMNLVWNAQTATLSYMESGNIPLTCATNTAFNVAADKVPATAHTMCAP
jgi:Cytochrome c554 and c-prime